MSYDIDLLIDTGGPEPYSVAEFNITYNILEMLRLALRETWPGNSYPGGSQVTSLADLHTWKSGSVIVPITLALVFLKDPANEEALRLLEPANGWGTLEQLIDFLTTLRVVLGNHPKTTFFVS